MCEYMYICIYYIYIQCIHTYVCMYIYVCVYIEEAKKIIFSTNI